MPRQARRVNKRSAPTRRTYYKGRGAYKKTVTTKDKAPKQKLEDRSAVSIGRKIGKEIGSALGTGAGFLYNHFFGRGEYGVQNNSLLRANPGNPDMPQIINSVAAQAARNGGVLFRKSEYLGDVISGSANTFDLNHYHVNPGLSDTFPWLSQCAQNFQQYEIIGMYFEYRSMSADALNSTNTALGQIILGCDYNAGNDDFASKNEMENYENSISVKPSQSVRYFLECNPQVTPVTKLYTRSGDVPADQDIRLYDLGKFQIATNGLQASNVNLGELWICYEVICYKSKLFSTLLNNCNFFMSRSYSGYTNALPLGGFVSDSPDNTLDISVDDTHIYFPGEKSYIQQYLLYLSWDGSAVSLVYPAISPADIYLSTLFKTPNSIAGVTEASVMILCRILPNVANPYITFGGAGTIPGLGNGRLMITEIAENINYQFFN